MEKRRRQVRRYDQPGKRSGEISRHRTSRNSRWFQVHRRTHQSRQNCSRRGRERRTLHSPPRRRKRWHCRRPPYVRDGCRPSQVTFPTIKRPIVKVGSLYPQRDNFRLTAQVKAKFTSKLGVDPHDFCGRKVKQIVRKDGLKLLFDDGSWVCYRLSGTEPVVRVYSEACTQSDLKKLSEAAQQWIFD